MNYDNLNTIYKHWRKDIYPHLACHMTITSFDDYVKRFSFLSSGKWLRDWDCAKLSRLGFAVNLEKFVKKYKDHCVSFSAGGKPEEGIQRIVYQISPTLHVEATVWMWMENDILQSYASLIACYHKEDEFLHFFDAVYSIRKEGNTEEKETAGGFANLIKLHNS